MSVNLENVFSDRFRVFCHGLCNMTQRLIPFSLREIYVCRPVCSDSGLPEIAVGLDNNEPTFDTENSLSCRQIHALSHLVSERFFQYCPAFP
jgi:hypothetical protein